MEGLHSFLSPFWARKGDVGLQAPVGLSPDHRAPACPEASCENLMCQEVPQPSPRTAPLSPPAWGQGTSQAFLRRGLVKVGGLPRPQPVPAAGVGVPQAWASNRAQPCSEQYGVVFTSLCPSWAAGLKAEPRYLGAVCPQASHSASLSSHWKPG